ncbi:hypothetical protein [Polymorphospora rubra]
MNGISGVIPRLAEIARMRFPESFPQWFVEQTGQAGTTVVTL